MATFYKYKERDDISKSMIDWSGLTKKISDDLIAEKNRRDQLKFELEEDQLNKIKTVEEFTQGLDPSMNQAMIKIADQYKDYLLMSHRMMKNGLVSVNDTKIRKQGAIDTFDSINNAAKEYNEKMSGFIETGGNLNDFFAKYAANALNISNSQLVIDKMGRGTFIKIDENGNEIAMPATSFGTLLNTKFDRFDANKEFDEATNKIANITIAESGYFSVTDFRQDKELYNDWLTNSTSYILNSDKKIAEVAADLLHIEVTDNKEKAKNEGLLYAEWKNNQMTVNVDYVEDRVTEAVKVGLESRLDRIEQRTPYSPSAAEINARADKESKEAKFNNIIAALQGNENKYKTIFDEITGDVFVPSTSSGFIQIPGEAAIEIKKNGAIQSIGDIGGRIAAQLGLGSEEFQEFARKKGVSDNMASENVLKFKEFKNIAPLSINTKENRETLQEALSPEKEGFDKQGKKAIIPKEEPEIRDSVVNAIRVIAGDRLKITRAARGVGIESASGDKEFYNLATIQNDPAGILRDIERLVNAPTKNVILNASQRKK